MGGWQRRELLAVGTRAPEFRLRRLDGGEESLSEILARGPAVLVFFKVSCPVCQYTFPFLERLYRGGGAAVQIFGISQDDAAATREFNSEFGVTFPTLLDGRDGGYPVSNAYGISSVPTLFLVERDGTIVVSESGFSKGDLETVGQRAGTAPFRAGERVPELRPG